MPRRLAAIAVFASLAGCAFGMSHRAPPVVRQPDQPIPCTSNRLLSGLDLACAAYFAAWAVSQARSPDCGDVPFERECLQGRNGTVAALTGLAAACLASSVWGLANAGRCTDLKQWNALCIRGDEAACRHLSPGWKAPPAPAQRTDGPPAGSACVAAFQCAAGLACVEGLCRWPFAPIAPLDYLGQPRRP